MFLVWLIVALICPPLGAAWALAWLLVQRSIARELSTEGGRYRMRQEAAAQGYSQAEIEAAIPLHGWRS